MTDHDGREAATLGDAAAAGLVFGSSAAVLVVELVALRLLAPYLGLTLETNTLVIGIALTAIAIGSWVGGRAADTVPPRRTLGPLLAISGVVVAATPSTVRAAGASGSDDLVLLVAAAAILVPGMLLSAVTPMVTKLRLTDLDRTGAVVGRLSGIGTAGAIFGTVVTGFVLVSTVPVTGILVGLGAALVVSAVAVEVLVRGWRFGIGPAALVVVGGLATAVVPDACDVETTYHCASVVADPERDGGRTLVLDGLRHSYVDVDDPTHLEFEYVRTIAAAVDTVHPDDRPVDAYHLGGGGLTIPRWLAATRPGSRSVVSEIDPGVVQVDRDRLGLETGPDLQVRVEDGRLGLGRLDAASRDLVVGDAFGGISPPWHLTTSEAIAEVRRVLTDDGTYVANVIDYGPLDFARAEARTIAGVFEHVAVAGDPDAFRFEGGGNLVIVASDVPIDAAGLTSRLSERDVPWRVVTGTELRTWIGDARALTDDRAPTDQLLTPYAVAS
ncbi:MULTISPECIES: fused MFS/spermidine synthase [Aeromicrobium]|uniref:fused MFS/spermidine synthase n=1 Tax=Aeromicrobium TaxID=2040 RepID=UPI0006FA0805|nr:MULTISPECIES: fused MFS/spermidine synthase [Aeromicrobium]KQX74385.1 spermidine synthase [Aeromicrobium sp. Root472D3]MCL8253162.1 fused MFS/spermidine synthase [Aeromicrobium fastidiosum]